MEGVFRFGDVGSALSVHNVDAEADNSFVREVHSEAVLDVKGPALAREQVGHEKDLTADPGDGRREGVL